MLTQALKNTAVAAGNRKGAREKKIPLMTVSHKVIPFSIVHMIPLTAFFLEVSAIDWVVCFVGYLIRLFFVTGVYHRYFSHRSYKMNRFWQCIMAFLAEATVQKGVLWWASHHREHHLKSDQQDDTHSTFKHGFWYAHLGWIINNHNDFPDYKNVKDFVRFPELRWLDKHYWFPPIVLGVLHFLVGGWSMLVIGFFLSTVISYHITFLINSLMHTLGKPRYKSGDHSKNSLILALLTLGEGWHNNHHYFPSSCRQGFYWWEIDITYYLLCLLKKIGVIRSIHNVTMKMRESNKLKYMDSEEKKAYRKELGLAAG